MKILALDTAASFCAAALYDSDKALVLAQRRENIGKGHAEKLMPMIDDIMKQAGFAMQAIDRIAVNIGPGSFTGIRVGVAAARGFALALKKPAIGISAFEAIHHQAHADFPGRTIRIALEAYRDGLYVQDFAADGNAVNQAGLRTPQQAAADFRPDMVLAGSGAEKIAALLATAPVIANTLSTGDIASYACLAMSQDKTSPPSPLYLRAPDAKPQTGYALPRRETRI